MKPLDGLLVLDLTRLLPGAVASQILLNFGADVIKIEELEHGDYGRELPPLIGDESALFLLTNGGKRSVAINLKNPAGRDAFLRLVARADVLLEGFRPGVMKRLGLDYETLRVHNERLIYVALTGYGQQGPYSQRASHDVNYLSLGGLLELNGPTSGPPVIPDVQIADLAGGAMQAVTGLLLALAARARTGRGQMVDVAMLDGIASLLAVPLARFAASGRPPTRGDELLSGRYACYRVYKTRDGRYLAVGALEPKFWTTLCGVLGCERFVPDQFAEGARQAEIIETLAGIFKTLDASEWAARFENQDACVTIVQTLSEVVRDPHLRAREMFVSVERGQAGILEQIGVSPKLSETPGALSREPAPRLGQQTREVLLWCGLSIEEVDALERDKVIQT